MNHFFHFDDESSAKQTLTAYMMDGEWDTSRVIPDQRVVLARAEWDDSDPENPVQLSPELTMPGYFLTISLPLLDEALRDLPGGACRLIGDSGTGVLVYTAPDLDTDLLATALIEPVPAGAVYTFGS
jgi:hypothetical protein